MQKLIVGALASAITLLAQGAHAVLPVSLGYVITAQGTALRPILGIPGAARLGSQIPVPGASALFLPPAAAYVLASTASGLAWEPAQNIGTPETSGGLIPIAGTAPGADVIAFSPSGSAAAVYARSSGSVQVITGWPQQPVLAKSLPLADEPKALAISDDGQTVLAQNSAGVISDVQRGTVVDETGVRGGIFAPGGADTFLADAASGRAWQSSRALAPIPQPLALESSQDKRVIFLASGTRPGVWTLDRPSGALRSYAAAAPVRSLRALSLPDVYLASFSDGSNGLLVWHNGRLSFSIVGVAREADAAFTAGMPGRGQ